MPFRISRKLIAAVPAALLLAVPVSPAAAWDEVCVKFAAGVGYAGHFHVIHSFETNANGKMSGKVIADGFMGRVEESPDELRAEMDAISDELAEARRREGESRRKFEAFGPPPVDEHSADRWHYDILNSERRLTRDNRWVIERRLRELSRRPLAWVPDLIHGLPRDAFTADDEALPARDAIRSGLIRFPNTGCVSIRDVPEGAPFYVLLNARGKPGRNHVLCGTHHTNPNWWYANRPNRWTQKIEYNARGSLFSPRCEYSKEY